jgi:hypothetical protein
MPRSVADAFDDAFDEVVHPLLATPALTSGRTALGPNGDREADPCEHAAAMTAQPSMEKIPGQRPNMIHPRQETSA